ncbi:winged helix-turn-helix domain-containing protein [Ruminococcus sp. OA3]|uniref:ArsR family transcriptional regulator n=1 Tax=Ruminococcus sp. OA3 TaxID=2914164 RepID=UPI001F0510B0|nr:ArsR family transcriptional regulator [Ruminococcus sp. OA3]MCH1981996.1 winged helix-turn-helix domain-containing protein [Ruminococcus sp. OA3]
MTINRNLNKYFEIIGLLYSSTHPEGLAKEVWDKAAAEHGINGDELYQKAGATYKKYLTAFQKNMTAENLEDFDFFFSDEADDFILFLQTVCAEHTEWFEGDPGGITEDAVVLAFANRLTADDAESFAAPPSTDELIQLLQAVGFSSEICWKLMLIMQSPKKKLENLTAIVVNSIPAYEKAVTAIRKPLDKLLANFPSGEYISSAMKEDAVLTPVMIFPTGELIDTNETTSNAYIGLFVADVYQMMKKPQNFRGNLLPVLKALSDGSKFDILLSLMTSPKYNLELAEELNLTAATVSHHMSVLLTYQLVNVEKRDGRVYYTLSKDTLRDLLSKLHSIFSI